MKRDFDRALADILPRVQGLRAVVISAAPDGLIAWCWSRDDRPEVALGFAALDRAATACLDELGASQAGRSLLLTAKDAWVASWPLGEANSETDSRARLIVTTVFDGELQNGLVMVYGTRVRRRLREVLEAAEQTGSDTLAAKLARVLLRAPEPVEAFAALAADAGLEPHALSNLTRLDHDARARVLASIQRAS